MATGMQTTANAFQAGSAGELDIKIDGFDKFFKWMLRSQPVYRQFVDVYPVDPTNRSRTYHLPKFQYLPGGDRTLAEVGDGDGFELPEALEVVVSATELGHRSERTYRLGEGDATYIEIDPTINVQLATDAVDTLDRLVRDTLLSGDNRTTSDAGNADPAPEAVNTLTADDTFSARLIIRAVAMLRQRSVVPLRNGQYVSIISPATSVDIREETGAAAWVFPHQYQDTAALYNGEVGTFGGAIFLETPRAHYEADGAEGAEVHRTLFLGRESTAEAVWQEPSVGLSPVTDKYARHRGTYWHADVGHAVYRQEAIQRVEHGVSTPIA